MGYCCRTRLAAAEVVAAGAAIAAGSTPVAGLAAEPPVVGGSTVAPAVGVGTRLGLAAQPVGARTLLALVAAAKQAVVAGVPTPAAQLVDVAVLLAEAVAVPTAKHMG